ncbi:unnamed protein product, partial [Discosporangium mesarthrocarpum]
SQREGSHNLQLLSRLGEVRIHRVFRRGHSRPENGSRSRAPAILSRHSLKPWINPWINAVDLQPRQHFVSLMGVLDGVLLPSSPPHLMHSYMRMHTTDGFASMDVTDRKLFNAAQAQLLREEPSEGLGMHSKGIVDWDGRSEYFSHMANEAGGQVFKDTGVI